MKNETCKHCERYSPNETEDAPVCKSCQALIDNAKREQRRVSDRAMVVFMTLVGTIVLLSHLGVRFV